MADPLAPPSPGGRKRGVVQVQAFQLAAGGPTNDFADKEKANDLADKEKESQEGDAQNSALLEETTPEVFAEKGLPQVDNNDPASANWGEIGSPLQIKGFAGPGRYLRNGGVSALLAGGQPPGEHGLLWGPRSWP